MNEHKFILTEKYEGNCSWLNAFLSITIPVNDKNPYIQGKK